MADNHRLFTDEARVAPPGDEEDSLPDVDPADGAGRTVDHRIGQRYPVHRVPFAWRVDPTAKGRRRKARPLQGFLLDISLSGCRALAPTNPAVLVGYRVAIEIGGVACTVVVRRVGPSDEAGLSEYGMEFLPEAMAEAAELVGRVAPFLDDRYTSGARSFY